MASVAARLRVLCAATVGSLGSRALRREPWQGRGSGGGGEKGGGAPLLFSRLRLSSRLRTQERDYPRDSSSPPSLAYARRGWAVSALGLAWRGCPWGLLQGGGKGRVMGG